MIIFDDFSLSSFIRFSEIYTYFVKVIAELENGKTMVEKRRRIITKDGTFDFMGAVSETYGMAVNKSYFNGKNLEFSVSLFDMNESKLSMIFIGKEFTRIRTASITYSFLRYLNLRPENALILGYGFQAYGQSMALAELGIKNINVWGRDKEKGKMFSKMLRERLNVESSFIEGNNLDGYDVIVTSTSAKIPILKEGDFKNSVIIAIGSYTNSMAEIDNNIICGSKSLLVDSKEQSMDESGEIFNAINSGCIKFGDIQEISELFSKGVMRSRGEYGPIILKSMGMAAEDLAAAIAIYYKYNQRM